jgi:translation elongation factor EF-Tu-like GTPase
MAANQVLQQTAAAILVFASSLSLSAAAAAERGRSARSAQDVQPLMTIEGISRVPGRPPFVFGNLSGGSMRVGQTVVLRLGAVERTAEVVEIRLGFDRVPPTFASVGANVALGLRGDGLEVVRDGEAWQVVGECQ